MGERENSKRIEHRTIGFIACYKGQEIGRAVSLQELSNRVKVKKLMGKKGLVIKHDVPEDLIAVY